MLRTITIISLMLVAITCSAQEKKTGKFGSFLKKVTTTVTSVRNDSVSNEKSGVSQERHNEKFNASSNEYLQKSKDARSSYDNLGNMNIKSGVLKPNKKTSSANTTPKEAPKPAIDVDSTLTEYDKVLKLSVELTKRNKEVYKAYIEAMGKGVQDQIKKMEAQVKETTEQMKKTDEAKTQLKQKIDSNAKAMTDEQKARLDSIEKEYVKLRDATYTN